MRIRVMKFGGTSVATPEARMQAALRVTSAHEQGYHPVVVVSAIGRRGAPYATDTLIGILREIDATVEPDARELDLMIACGEIFSAVVFAHLLKTLGQPAMAFRGGQAGIRTDGVYGNARVVAVNPIAIRKTLEAGKIPVVCGFQGAFNPENLPGGELTTLGRGGSDTTAAAIGAALGADAVEIYTDVDGVKTADPDFVRVAPTLRRVSYDEVAEIAHLGAKVLHPRAAEIAMKFGAPLWVKSTFSDDPGTQVVPNEAMPDRKVTGVTHTGKLVYLSFNLRSASEAHRTVLESYVYETMARYAINLYMMQITPTGIGFAVQRDQWPVVRDVLDGLVAPVGEPASVYVFQVGAAASKKAETQSGLLAPLGISTKLEIEITEGCTMVSVIGREFMRMPGAFLSVLETLSGAQIPVLQTTDSDLSLSCLISESETERAVRLLHDRFRLEEAS